MEGSDVYIFDEENPLLHDMRPILLNDTRNIDFMETPKYLVELPKNPHHTVPLRKLPHRSRGVSIYNTELQPDSTRQSERERFESFFDNFRQDSRKNNLVDNSNDKLVHSQSIYNGQDCETIQSIQVNQKYDTKDVDLFKEKSQSPKHRNNNQFYIKILHNEHHGDTGKENNAQGYSLATQQTNKTKVSEKEQGMVVKYETDVKGAKEYKKSPFNVETNQSPFKSNIYDIHLDLVLVSSQESVNNTNHLQKIQRNNMKNQRKHSVKNIKENNIHTYNSIPNKLHGNTKRVVKETNKNSKKLLTKIQKSESRKDMDIYPSNIQDKLDNKRIGQHKRKDTLHDQKPFEEEDKRRKNLAVTGPNDQRYNEDNPYGKNTRHNITDLDIVNRKDYNKNSSENNRKQPPKNDKSEGQPKKPLFHKKLYIYLPKKETSKWFHAHISVDKNHQMEIFHESTVNIKAFKL